MTIVPRENIRLTRRDYLGRRIYFVTISTERRRVIFQEANRATAAIAGLRKVSEARNCFVACVLAKDEAGGWRLSSTVEK
jgi:hypothetical protein